MPFIDDRGRVFGRLNLIDAAVAAALVLLLALGVSAYLLFRAPTPKLFSVRPDTLQPMTKAQRVYIQGENLRPYLRVTFNGKKAESVLLADFTSAEVVPPELEPGRYDVTMYDQAREVGRLTNAITVPVPPPEPRATVRLVGMFRGLTSENAGKLLKNRALGETGKPPIGEILDASPPRVEERWITAGDLTVSIPVGSAYAVPATVRIECTLRDRQCRVADTQVGTRAVVRLPTAVGSVEYHIDDVRPDREPIDLDARVTFLTRPGVAQLVAAGDQNTAGITAPVSLAWIVSVGPAQLTMGQAAIEIDRSGVVTQRFAATIPEPLTKFDAVVHLRVDETPVGWRFYGEPIKVGAPLTFESARYVIRGWINSVQQSARPLPEQTQKP